MVTHSFDFTKNGELELLRFPPFRSELLQQSYWNPADELGRIKIVVSECFPRDSVTVPTERVKNIVAFSFQHAPLGKPLRITLPYSQMNGPTIGNRRLC